MRELGYFVCSFTATGRVSVATSNLKYEKTSMRSIKRTTSYIYIEENFIVDRIGVVIFLKWKVLEIRNISFDSAK